MPSDEPETVDRRVRRSRRALSQALIELVLEKGYDATTIDDITQRADVARATFYAHYADKHSLLVSIASSLSDDAERVIMPRAPVSATVRGEISLLLFQHAEEHRDAYRVVLCGAGDPPAYEVLVRALSRLALTIFANRGAALQLTPRLPPEFLARAWVGVHIALLSWWLFDDAPYTAADMALMRTRYDTYGSRWGHGFEPGQPVFDESLFDASSSSRM